MQTKGVCAWTVTCWDQHHVCCTQPRAFKASTLAHLIAHICTPALVCINTEMQTCSTNFLLRMISTHFTCMPLRLQRTDHEPGFFF